MTQATDNISLNKVDVDFLESINVKDAMLDDFIHRFSSELFIPPKCIHPRTPGDGCLFSRRAEELLDRSKSGPSPRLGTPGPHGINLILRLFGPLAGFQIASVNELRIKHLRVMADDNVKGFKIVPDVCDEKRIVKVVRSLVLPFMGAKDPKATLVLWTGTKSLHDGTEHSTDVRIEMSGFDIIEPDLLISLAQKNLVPNLLAELGEVAEEDFTTSAWYGHWKVP